jgi:hypothetical protein
VVSKKQAEQEAAAELAAILAQFNVSNVEPETVHGAPVKPEELDDPPQRVAFRGQAVLRSLEYPSEERLTKVCKYSECGNVFTSNYHSVAYCSMLCMEHELKKHFGLAWRPHARIKKERWEVQAEPEMIPMRALQAMKMIVARVESDLGRPIEIDEQAFSRIPSGILKETQSPLVSESPVVSSQVSEQVHPLSDKKKVLVPQEPNSEESDDSLSWLFSD